MEWNGMKKTIFGLVVTLYRSLARSLEANFNSSFLPVLW